MKKETVTVRKKKYTIELASSVNDFPASYYQIVGNPTDHSDAIETFISLYKKTPDANVICMPSTLGKSSNLSAIYCFTLNDVI